VLQLFLYEFFSPCLLAIDYSIVIKMVTRTTQALNFLDFLKEKAYRICVKFKLSVSIYEKS